MLFHVHIHNLNMYVLITKTHIETNSDIAQSVAISAQRVALPGHVVDFVVVLAIALNR